MMNDDITLLREFAASQSEHAFETLVARHIHLVHSAALRQVRDPHLAEEITQAVFIILARKAGSLGEKTILSGWLYRTAQYASADALKIQRRRQRREQEAYMQSILENSQTETAWQELSPLLDEAMTRLAQTDRDAVVLRYFENKSLREVGGALGMQERAAQKRITRAVEKLRTFFAKRGVALSVAAIAGAVSANSVQAAPAALTKTISAVAIAKGAAASGSTLTLINGALKTMAWTKAKTAIAIGVGVFLVVGTTTTVIVKKIHSPQVDDSLWSVNSDNFAKVPAVLILRPTHFPNRWGSVESGNKVIGQNMTTASLFVRAYKWSPSRMVLPPDTAGGHYDLMLTLPSHEDESLQAEIKMKLALAARVELREADVLLLKARNPSRLESKASNGGSPRSYVTSDQTTGRMVISNVPVSALASTLENFFEKPTIDQTGLTGQYDLNLQWKTRDQQSEKEAAVRNQLDQLGLELVPSREPIEILVVEKVK